jgi:hypothetical protein
VQQHRCSVGVQQALSRLSALLTLQEAADTLSHWFPLPMSARQALTLIPPVGEAFKEQEEERQQPLFEQAGQARGQDEPAKRQVALPIRRMYVEIDGVMAR